MKLWIDDVRPAPDGYVWCRSVDDAKYCIIRSRNVDRNSKKLSTIELIDIDHSVLRIKKKLKITVLTQRFRSEELIRKQMEGSMI